MVQRMTGWQRSATAATRAGNPQQVGAATLTAGLLAALQATKYAGTRQQTPEQPVNFAQHDKLTAIA